MFQLQQYCTVHLRGLCGNINKFHVKNSPYTSQMTVNNPLDMGSMSGYWVVYPVDLYV